MFAGPPNGKSLVHRKPASFEDQERVSEDCEAFVYAKVDKQLPKKEFVTRMRMQPGSKTEVDLELTRDNGKENFCVKSGTATIEDEHNGVCNVLKVKIDPGHYDCG